MLRKALAVLATAAVLVTLSAASVAAAPRSFTFNVPMSGAQEPFGAGDPNATGSATLMLSPGAKEVCYTISWANIGNTTDDRVWGGHIHIGPAGANGDIFIHLFGGPPESMNTSFPGTGGTSGCVDAPSSAIARIIANPSGYYVNVHSNDYPGGAIRGQLG
jgi:hypothetical protein